MSDTIITRKTNGSLKFSVYRKPTHTDQYLQFDSHQPMEHKMGMTRTLTHRANTVITEDEDKEEEVQHIKKVLSIAGYSKWPWQAAGSKKLHPPPNQRGHTRPGNYLSHP